MPVGRVVSLLPATNFKAYSRRMDSAFSESYEALLSHLLDRRHLNPVALDRARRLIAEQEDRFVSVLTQLGLVSERQMAEALSEFLGLALIEPRDFPTEVVAEQKLPAQFLKSARVLPLRETPDSIAIAMADPLDGNTIETVAFATGKRVERHVACVSDIEAAWQQLYGAAPEARAAATGPTEIGLAEDTDRLKDLASEAPIIRIVNQMIARAVDAHASDIHIEPTPERLRVRYRLDGMLKDIDSFSLSIAAPITSRIKILAKLNIAEHRLAQDGRIRMTVRGNDIDLRVSTTPTIHGEGVVLRLLDRSRLPLDFETLGFEPVLLGRFMKVLDQPHGIMLVTGPTGSGKTTTLYASLRTLNTAERKILTIEDPVEYQLDGVNQLQVKPQIGLTFSSALRSFLRQDPDIMMIGEIRDLETAQIAVQSALTGHLILSTLHTNDAISALTRLVDMGLEHYLLTATINGVVGQRLVRTLCPHCKQPYEVSEEMAGFLGLAERLHAQQPLLLYRPVGCPTCEGSGFRGRTSIIELFAMSDPIRDLVLRKADVADIRRQTAEDGMESMRTHGIGKALAGITSIEEVLRVTQNH